MAIRTASSNLVRFISHKMLGRLKSLAGMMLEMVLLFEHSFCNDSFSWIIGLIK